MFSIQLEKDFHKNSLCRVIFSIRTWFVWFIFFIDFFSVSVAFHLLLTVSEFCGCIDLQWGGFLLTAIPVSIGYSIVIYLLGLSYYFVVPLPIIFAMSTTCIKKVSQWNKCIQISFYSEYQWKFYKFHCSLSRKCELFFEFFFFFVFYVFNHFDQQKQAEGMILLVIFWSIALIATIIFYGFALCVYFIEPLYRKFLNSDHAIKEILLIWPLIIGTTQICLLLSNVCMMVCKMEIFLSFSLSLQWLFGILQPFHIRCTSDSMKKVVVVVKPNRSFQWLTRSRKKRNQQQLLQHQHDQHTMIMSAKFKRFCSTNSCSCQLNSDTKQIHINFKSISSTSCVEQL